MTLTTTEILLELYWKSKKIVEGFRFEPNDYLTRNTVADCLTVFFEDLQKQRQITDYKVVCDESNNTPTTIDNHQLYVDIAIKIYPTDLHRFSIGI